MPANKNQHFLPRAYFRAFSKDRNGAALNLYNIGARRPIANASVRGQCAKRYFYGANLKLEKALKVYEDEYAAILRGLSGPSPTITTGDLTTLRDFTALQHCRTEAATLRAQSITHGMQDTLQQEFATGADSLNLTTHEHMRIALSMYPNVRHAISDLQICILENRTSVEFITSDDPVVYTSRFHAEKVQSNNFGITAAGVFFVLPLSPRLLLLCYDADVYRLRSLNRYAAVVRNLHDVRACNELQILNAQNNIYFSDWEQRDEVHSHVDHTARRRGTSGTRFLTYVADSKTATGTLFRLAKPGTLKPTDEAMVRIANIHTFPRRWLSALPFRWRPRFRNEGSLGGPVREQTWRARYPRN